jgi:hypothetical protein
MRASPNIWMVGATIGIFAGVFVASRELFESGQTDIRGVLLTASIGFILGVAVMGLRNWWVERRGGGRRKP